jgi:hypothetical protein
MRVLTPSPGTQSDFDDVSPPLQFVDQLFYEWRVIARKRTAERFLNLFILQFRQRFHRGKVVQQG